MGTRGRARVYEEALAIMELATEFTWWKQLRNFLLSLSQENTFLNLFAMVFKETNFKK